MTEQTPDQKEQDIVALLISLAKRRGFIFQGSEIYGGLAGTWDYGHYGVALKNNIKNLWWKRFVLNRTDMFGMDAAILMNQKAWIASGHVGGFSDPLVEDVKTKRRYRADHLLEDAGIETKGLNIQQLDTLIKEKKIKSPDGNPLGDVRQFNMMFKTHVGAIEDDTSVSYLRPETAQGMFVNYKNLMDSIHPKLPFGMAQIGKAFRNEIAPRDFIFRTREFEQMEIEYFVRPQEWEGVFQHFVEQTREWITDLGLPADSVVEYEVPESDRAHYSKRTIDFEYKYPFGQKELYGLAYRTDYDLKAHIEHSKVDLSYFDEETKERFVPHVIEPSYGVDRSVFAALCAAYTTDTSGSEPRVYLKLPYAIAPVKIAVFPLLKNKPALTEYAEQLFKTLKKSVGAVEYDDGGNIGKRYRRQDEIGTPYCVTVDFQTLEDNTMTVRNRNTGEQQRLTIEQILALSTI